MLVWMIGACALRHSSNLSHTVNGAPVSFAANLIFTLTGQTMGIFDSADLLIV